MFLIVFNQLNCRSSCGLSFVLLDNYRMHCMQKHNGELRLLNCDNCNDVFTVQSHLEAHKESIHKEVSYDLSIFEDLKQEQLTCPFCEEKFEEVSLKSSYTIKGFQFLCPHATPPPKLRPKPQTPPPLALS